MGIKVVNRDLDRCGGEADRASPANISSKPKTPQDAKAFEIGSESKYKNGQSKTG